MQDISIAQEGSRNEIQEKANNIFKVDKTRNL